MMRMLRHTLCGLTVVLPSALMAQATPPSGNVPVSVALTFNATAANIADANRFWINGGAAELNAQLFRGLGFTASFTGLHSGNSGQGVPISLFMMTFGPSFEIHTRKAKHTGRLFAHGLLGEADGFAGVYPTVAGPTTSANSLAVQVGGGYDIDLSRHLAVRLVEADWLRTQLPNSTMNVQNDLKLGAGIVFHLQR